MHSVSDTVCKHPTFWGALPQRLQDLTKMRSESFKRQLPTFSINCRHTLNSEKQRSGKQYWKHFKLFTRLKGWNDTLNTSNFIIEAIFWWQSGIDLSKCLKLTIFQKVIIWLKALKLRARSDALFLLPHSNHHLI